MKDDFNNVAFNRTLRYRPALSDFSHQNETLDGKEHLEAGVDEERAEETDAVVS